MIESTRKKLFNTSETYGYECTGRVSITNKDKFTLQKIYQIFLDKKTIIYVLNPTDVNSANPEHQYAKFIRIKINYMRGKRIAEKLTKKQQRQKIRLIKQKILDKRDLSEDERGIFTLYEQQILSKKYALEVLSDEIILSDSFDSNLLVS